MGFGVWGLGFGVWDLGFEVWSLDFVNRGSGFVFVLGLRSGCFSRKFTVSQACPAVSVAKGAGGDVTVGSCSKVTSLCM